MSESAANESRVMDLVKGIAEAKRKLDGARSWSDWFHIDADPWRNEAWDIIKQTPQHTYMILTKRPGRIHRCLPADWGEGWPNVWLGVSIEDAAVLHRADQLRRIPAALRFISAEPLLGSLYTTTPDAMPGRDHVTGSAESVQRGDAVLSPCVAQRGRGGTHPADGVERSGLVGRQVDPRVPSSSRRAPLNLTGIGLVIVGGESGSRADARPMHPEWAREIRDHVLGAYPSIDLPLADPVTGNRAGVAAGFPIGLRPAFHFKQWGAYAPAASGVYPGDICVSEDGTFDTAGPDYVCFANESDGTHMRYMGGGPDAGGKLLDGVEWCELPDWQKGNG